MIRIVEFLVSLMALDARGQRAVDASIADWRHELKRASITGRTLLVNVWSAIGVVRVLANAGSAELRSAPVSSFVWRLGAIAGSVLLAALVLLSGFVLLPSSLAYSSYETWRYFANASVPEPDVTRRLLSGFTVLTVIAAVFSMVSVWLLFTFANRIRRVGGVKGWVIGLGVVVLAFIAGTGLPFVPFPILRIPLTLSWPFLLLAALLWATKYLARIDDARSANNVVLPSNGATS